MYPIVLYMWEGGSTRRGLYITFGICCVCEVTRAGRGLCTPLLCRRVWEDYGGRWLCTPSYGGFVRRVEKEEMDVHIIALYTRVL